MLTDSARFSSQINNTQQKIITRNLIVKDNNNHITCTQVIFGQFVPGKTPEGKPVQQIWILLLLSRKIQRSLTIKSAQPNTKPPQQMYAPLLQIPLIRSIGKDLCNVEDVCQSQCRSLLCLPANSLSKPSSNSPLSLFRKLPLSCA